MTIAAVRFVSMLAVINAVSMGPSENVETLLGRYRQNADRSESCIVKYEATEKYTTTTDPCKMTVNCFVGCFCYDPERAARRVHRWGGTEGTSTYVPKDSPQYLSVVWDGSVLSHYTASAKSDEGLVFLHTNPRDDAKKSVRYKNMITPFLGYYFNAFERVDAILGRAESISLRPESEMVNDVPCWVIEAETEYGHYVVWIDPEHGHQIAKARIRASQTKGHRFRDAPIRSPDTEYKLDVVCFESFDGFWIPDEGTWEYTSHSISGMESGTTTTDVKLIELVLDPDQEALNSFARDDIVDGSKAVAMPDSQITYRWQQGDLVPVFDEELVGRIDMMVGSLVAPSPNESLAGAVLSSGESKVDTSADLYGEVGDARERQAVLDAGKDSVEAQGEESKVRHPHCGLYCLYTVMNLIGRDVGFRALVKPEYLGHRKGSSLGELRRAARDYGFGAEIVTRLTTRGLRRCPYRAILHVRSHGVSPDYDHYELFLGVEKGKARLCNPPEPPRLVAFGDLASRWDGMGVFISDGLLDVGSITTPDRQRWLLFGMIGVLRTCK